MAATSSKLRQVLDYWPCETCLQHPSSEQEYLCSVCARLTRTIALKGPPGPPRPEEAPVVLDASPGALDKILLTSDEWAELTGEGRRRRAEDEEAAADLARRMRSMGTRPDVDVVDAVHDLGDRVYPLERLDEAGLVKFAEEEPAEDEELLEWEESEGSPKTFEPTWETEGVPPEPLPGSEASELAEKISRLAEEVRTMGREGRSRSPVSPEGRTPKGGRSKMAARRKTSKSKGRKGPARKKARKTTKKRRKVSRKTARMGRKHARLAARKKRKTVRKKRTTRKKAAKRKKKK